jgi:hypothetical protein
MRLAALLMTALSLAAADSKNAAPKSEAPPPDTILRAMKDELDRSKGLALASLDLPYYVEYSVEDVRAFSVSASLGGLFSVNQNRFRVPRVRVRVGSYGFDNTNYIYSDYYSGTRYDSDQLSLDDNYAVLRNTFWLATDRAYKGAVEAIARKRAALKNITVNETLPDFWKAQPAEKILPPARSFADAEKWAPRVRSLSSEFVRYPEVLTSLVTFEASTSTFHMRNSEGTTIRVPDSVFSLQVRASGQAKDGTLVRDGMVLPVLEAGQMPADDVMRRAVREVAERVKALIAAPVGETYSGPVLFEGVAAAQIFAEVLGPHLALPRRPVSEPGRPMPFLTSELEGRIGSRVLPDFIDVVDDPTQTQWNKTPLLGHYIVDEEGVAPNPLTLIEKGKLKTFLLTRQPVNGFEASNGRARIPGPFGAHRATYGNLLVRASESVSAEELRKKLMDMCKDRGKPYGIVVRRMDFPSSASGEELRRIMASSGQSGSARPISSPLLVYRVFPDGREELVRGLRFRGLSVRSFKDVIAVSQDSQAFHFLNNLVPLALVGGGGYIAPSSVVAPSVLFDDLELEKPQDETPNLPLVSPPPLTASR